MPNMIIEAKEPSLGNSLRRLARREKLSIADVESIMLRVRHYANDLDDAEFANSLVAESGDYLPTHWLRSLIRAESTKEELRPYIEQNKAFFARLVELLPELIGYFRQSGPEHIIGLITCIDDCHNDYHVSAKSLRKDKTLREAFRSLDIATEATTSAMRAIQAVRKYLDYEYEEYSSLYFQGTNSRFPRDIGQLIQELEVCAGVLSIVRAGTAHDEKSLFLTGNDKRTVLVGYAYMMSIMWEGPKLLTTPGSDFSNLCSLLLEAVTGIRDESLAGVINRYARSDERKRRDAEELEFREQEDCNDNFEAANREMKASTRQIETCNSLLGTDNLAEFARGLLRMKLHHQTKNYEAARNSYGPHQTRIQHLNEEQLEKLGASKFSPRELANLDRTLGDARRAAREKGIDI